MAGLEWHKAAVGWGVSHPGKTERELLKVGNYNTQNP